MPHYSFTSLSDGDFEDLVNDLLNASLKIRFQQFPKGRDSGIDLLYGLRLRRSTVVQCKHYCRSKYAHLKTKLVSEELAKIQKLKPKRYILATSLPLTPANKEELLQILLTFRTSRVDYLRITAARG